MKKTFQLLLNDSNPIIFDATVKTTHETNIKVHDFFEQDIPCLILSIKHDQLNTLLDLTKTSPYTLIYFDNGFDDKKKGLNGLFPEFASSISDSCNQKQVILALKGIVNQSVEHKFLD